MKRFSFAILALTLVSGCTLTRGSSIVVGPHRAAIDPAMVKLYIEPPPHYQEIAIISADARNAFASQQNLADNTIERMKREAAKLGANGVLLRDMGDKQLGSTGFANVQMYGNTGFVTGSSVPQIAKTGSGIAIFVTDDDSPTAQPPSPAPCLACQNMTGH